jgi:hypothetical protein
VGIKDAVMTHREAYFSTEPVIALGEYMISTYQ